MSKGRAFAAAATRAGWKVKVETDGGTLETVIAERVRSGKKERIIISWDQDSCVYDDETPRHTHGDRTRKVRNAAAARRVLAEGSDYEPEPPRPKKPEPTPSKPEPPDERIRPLPARRLPFKVSSPDRIVLAAVVGRQITWWSERKRRLETAEVLRDPDQRQLYMTRNRASRRVLNFAADGEGFRSIYVDAIIEVSPRKPPEPVDDNAGLE